MRDSDFMFLIYCLPELRKVAMVVPESLIDIDGQNNRRAERTLKEILMAAPGHRDSVLTTLGAAAPEADTAAAVPKPAPLQRAGGARPPSRRVLGETGSGILPDLGVRSLQDSTFPRPGNLLPGAKRQPGAAKQRRLHSKRSSGAARKLPRALPPSAASLCFASSSQRRGKGEGREREGRGGRGVGGCGGAGAQLASVCLAGVAVGVAATLLFASCRRPHRGCALADRSGGALNPRPNSPSVNRPRSPQGAGRAGTSPRHLRSYPARSSPSSARCSSGSSC